MQLDNWPYRQHELLKTALEATDSYLGIEKEAVAANMATNAMLHDFTYHMSRAHDALQTLGVLDQHQEYMASHVDVMSKLHGHKDSTIADLPYTHVPKADYGEVEESTAKAVLLGFRQFIHEEKISDEELRRMVDELTWEEVVDLYDEVELEYDEDEDDDEDDEEEELEEALTVQGRLKKKQAFARMRGKRNVARGIKLKRASSIETLKKRAKLAARRSLYKRFLRGRDKSTLSAAEKSRVEKQVGQLSYLQSNLANKMLPKMRDIEQKRLKKARAGGTKTKTSKAPGGTKNPKSKRR